MTKLTVVTLIAVVATALFTVGCSPSRATIVSSDQPYRERDLTEPDFIIVETLGVTPGEIRQPPELHPESSTDHTLTSKEAEIGREFAKVLREETLKALTEAGIRAYTRDKAPKGTWKTGVVDGYFLNGSGGSSSGALGFELDDDHFRIRVVVNIREVSIGDVVIDMRTRLHSRLAPRLIRDYVGEEAKLVAEKLVKELLIPAYERRGWKL